MKWWPFHLKIWQNSTLRRLTRMTFRWFDLKPSITTLRATQALIPASLLQWMWKKSVTWQQISRTTRPSLSRSKQESLTIATLLNLGKFSIESSKAVLSSVLKTGRSILKLTAHKYSQLQRSIPFPLLNLASLCQLFISMASHLKKSWPIL